MDAGRITSKIGDMRGTSRSPPGEGVLMNGEGEMVVPDSKPWLNFLTHFSNRPLIFG